MNPEDIDREIDRFWERVAPLEGAAFPPLPSAFGPPAAGEAALEVVALLKSRHLKREQGFEEALELRDRMVRETAEQLRRAEGELQRLRRSESLMEERLLQETAAAARELETARDLLQAQEERSLKETGALSEALGTARRELEAETRRRRELELAQGGLEERHLAELHEANERIARLEREAAKRAESCRRLETELKEAKEALEATVSELLAERREREVAERQRDEALKKAAGLEEHFKGHETLWDEERRQWQELLSRERAARQSEREELGARDRLIRVEQDARATAESQRKAPAVAAPPAGSLEQPGPAGPPSGGAPSGTDNPPARRRPWGWLESLIYRRR